MQIIEDEQSEGNPHPFEVESLLVNVIPSLLSLSGMLFSAHSSLDLPVKNYLRQIVLSSRAEHSYLRVALPRFYRPHWLESIS
jgi:hypothetical protein